jgi:hypothetical protein
MDLTGNPHVNDKPLYEKPFLFCTFVPRKFDLNTLPQSAVVELPKTLSPGVPGQQPIAENTSRLLPGSPDVRLWIATYTTSTDAPHPSPLAGSRKSLS